MEHINLLNAQVGISSILPVAQQEHLPEVSGFSTIINTNQIQNLDQFKQQTAKDNFTQRIAQDFAPQLTSNELLTPANFYSHLQTACFTLADVGTKEVADFIQQDIASLLQNRQLLTSFLNNQVSA